jgi:hypothetical protein
MICLKKYIKNSDPASIDQFIEEFVNVISEQRITFCLSFKFGNTFENKKVFRN